MIMCCDLMNTKNLCNESCGVENTSVLNKERAHMSTTNYFELTCTQYLHLLRYPNSLIPFHLNIMLLWWFIVASYS